MWAKTLKSVWTLQGQLSLVKEYGLRLLVPLRDLLCRNVVHEADLRLKRVLTFYALLHRPCMSSLHHTPPATDKIQKHAQVREARDHNRYSLSVKAGLSMSLHVCMPCCSTTHTRSQGELPHAHKKPRCCLLQSATQ